MITWASPDVAEFIFLAGFSAAKKGLQRAREINAACRFGHHSPADDVSKTCCVFRQKTELRKRDLILPKYHCFFRATNAPMQNFGAYDELRQGNEFAVSAGPPAELFKGRHQ
jgi:hypothetical protein